MHRKKPQPETTGYRGNSFSTGAQLAFRRGSRRRMLAAAVAALVGLAALILLGPSQEEIKKRFEYYGAPGDLKIMPEIAIEDGRDPVRRLPKTLQMPPPPARIEIEPEDPDQDAEKLHPRENLPQESPLTDWSTVEPNPAEESFEANQVELTLPRQSSPDWYILHQVLPEYPFTASEAEQRIPVIQVRVAIFVDPEGNVSEAIIQSEAASRVFQDEVLEKIRQWRFGWRIDPQAGRWIELTFNFKSTDTNRPRRES